MIKIRTKVYCLLPVQVVTNENVFNIERREYELTMAVSFTPYQDKPSVHSKWELLNKTNVDESQHEITA